MCATGAAINKLIIVLSRKRINNSGKFTGIFDPKISPPTSDKYINCVTDMTATINFAIGLVIVPAANTDGVNISVKPTIIVFDTASACGTSKSCNSGRNGNPNVSKIVV